MRQMSAYRGRRCFVAKSMTDIEQPPRRTRASWRPVASTVVGVALLGGAGWWWTHPYALPSAYGASVEADPRPYRTGVVWTAELTAPGHFPSEGALTLRSVEVRLDERHETEATLEVLRCTPIATDDGGHLSVGFGDERPSANYDCIPAVDGTRMGSQDQLVAVLTPEGPGKYVLRSATVSYRLDRSGLWRRGTDSTRLHAAVTYS